MSKSEIIEDEDSGSGGKGKKGHSYADILKGLGIDTKEFSLADMEEMFHQLRQEGVLEKGAKVIDLKTGKKKQTYTNTKTGRTYTVKQSSSEPVKTDEIADRKDVEYKAHSEKQDKPTPVPPFNPKPTKP